MVSKVGLGMTYIVPSADGACVLGMLNTSLCGSVYPCLLYPRTQIAMPVSLLLLCLHGEHIVA